MIRDGQDVFKIFFDLENDSEKTEPFNLVIKNEKFTCQAFAAGGDWQNPVLYYRCQSMGTDDYDKETFKIISFDTEIAPHRNSFFIFIPKKEEGNPNLTHGKKDGWVASNNGGEGSQEQEELSERKGREALKEFLASCCKPIKQEDLGPKESATVKEDIHDGLKAVFIALDDWCKQHGIFPDNVADYPDKQGYLVKPKSIKDSIYNYLKPHIEKHGLNCELDDDRSDGLLLTFTVKALHEGHWEVLTDKDKAEQSTKFSMLPSSDAERVRRSETMYQKRKGFTQRLDEYGYGGMIPVTIEPSSDIIGNRSSPFSPGEPKRPPLPYNKRKNISDLAQIPPYQHQSDFEDVLNVALDSVKPPEDEITPETHIVPDTTKPIKATTAARLDSLKAVAQPPEKTLVIPSDSASLETLDPSFKINNTQNLHVTGMAGVRPQTPQGETEPTSNATVPPAGGGAGSFMPPQPAVSSMKKIKKINPSVSHNLEG